MTTLKRALILPELPLAIAGEAIASIASPDPDRPATWLPGVVFGSSRDDAPRRTLVLADGARFEVPATMHLVDDVEVLAMPELLEPIGSSLGLIGLALLPAGLALYCDPRRIAGASA
ncbi:hypothetical protein ACNOYE_26030 [Nannocystaceae bacterium ST9]